MTEKTSQDTITDSKFWASLHKNGSFLLGTSDVHKESLFFLLSFKSNENLVMTSLRYLPLPRDLVQLRHIRRQLNFFFVSGVPLA